MTKNGVRAHLAALVRDGLVQPAGARRGPRRPYVTYDLTAQGQRLFPKAHEPVLLEILDVLEKKLAPPAFSSILHDAGERLLQKHLNGIGQLGQKQKLRKLIEFIGSSAKTKREQDHVLIRGCGCPLGKVTHVHPEICGVMAELLTEFLKVPVSERCEKGNSPRCCFALAVDSRS